MKDERAQLRNLLRTRLGLIWELAKVGGELDEEEARLAEVLKQHPEYTDIWEDAESLGSEEVTRDGVNPFVHVATHRVVENQLAENDPPQTTHTLEALLEVGYSRHDAVHAIGAIVADEIFGILQEGRPFDEDAYVEALEELVRTAKGRGRRGRHWRGGRRRRR
jgi:hypothetical protein